MTEWLNELVGEAIAPYATIAIALVIVFLLIAILFRIIKAFRSGSFGTMRHNRLGIVEAMQLEDKRRIVLIRRDNVEHLIMIGGENDLVIEQGIQRSVQQVRTATPSPQPAASTSQPATAAAQIRPDPRIQKTVTAQPVVNRVNPVQSDPTSNDSAKVKDVNRLLDQIAGD